MNKFIATLGASMFLLTSAVFADPLIENPGSDWEGKPQVEPQKDPKTLFTMLQCDGVSKNILDMVTGKYGESILAEAMGLIADAQTGRFHHGEMFLTVNPDSRSWSLVAVFADGTACMITNGRDFLPYTKPAKKL
tara:strand:- start:121 stop:525 length:405 start_codon:yes stop_codon:yes gene_type:complete